MSEPRKTETIEIGKGINYAKVAARSAEFHKDNDKCDIETSCEFKEGYVLFSAKVTTRKGTFTGHSMDKVSARQKQFEKQETIAVGRALAFAGYLATGDICSYEEISEVEESVTPMQLNSLKIKWAGEYSRAIDGLSRDERQRAFSAWCLEIVGEQVDYLDPQSWDRAWYRACWQRLTGTSPDVPFEE